MEIERPEGLTDEDWRSWALNRAALDRAAADWDGHLPRIRRNLATMRGAQAGGAERYLGRIEALVDQGPGPLREVLLRCDDEGQALRSVNPFAGVLGAAERNAILRATRRGAA